MRRTYLKLLKYFVVKEPETPLQLIHFVTSKCNAKCGHCFYWSQLNTKGELSLEEIDKITRHLPDLVILNISGGEPFIRPDFADVIKTYYHNTPVKEVTIPTNGTFTEKIKKDCTDILENCPDMDLNIVVSLDGIEKIHDEIRQVKDCYNKAKASFMMLKELKKLYPHLQVSIVSTLTSLNQDTLEELHHEIKQEWKPDVFSMNLIRGEAKKMDLFGVNLNYYKKFFQLQSKSRKKGMKSWIRDYMNKLRTGMIIKTVEEKKYILPCTAGTLMAVMYEKGDVYPCELLNHKPLGNVREFEYDFTKLWTSTVTKNSAKWIKDTKCYCTHECFQRFNIIYNPSFIAKNMITSWVGKSEIINSLKTNGSGDSSGEDLIHIGEIRGMRYKQDGLEQAVPSANKEKRKSFV
ncbi:MAG: radical SAM protein [bacterium]|nr:radical SAM protein [bacterium]